MEVRVACDDVTGGILTVGVLPVGWSLPPGAIVTIPPRVLHDCRWNGPSTGEEWIFVTENPSIASAAAELAAGGVLVRLLCTSGTPSAREVAAIARLAGTGWRVAIRADFDEAGLRHVATVLSAVPTSSAWRMGTSDYLASLDSADAENRTLFTGLPATPWDPTLEAVMRDRGLPAYEESLLPVLLEDLRRRAPLSSPP